ncbi:MAG TPA: methyltransferase domain-containing protein, partial [Chryseolinea sp.]|nr:methyltransferase domain-containing protein [Chryseolinea sp.]
MTFDQQTWEYLQGKKFANRIDVPISYHGPIRNRVEFLSGLAKDKRIVHLGCLDHMPLIADKIARGQWLHKELSAVATECIGIDIDRETMDHVKSKLGFDNILLGDFTKISFPEIKNKSWDYAILGELLEHIDNPVQYLSDIRNNYADCIRRIVVTVPNAWTQTTMRMASKSVEIINSDHRYWFTPYTLAKVLVQAGMVTEEMHFPNRVPLSSWE